MRSHILALTALSMLTAGPAFAQGSDGSLAAPAASAVAQHYTTEQTPLGDLLDDAAAKAVLEARIPALVGNPQIDMARGLTLKALQAYAPELTDETLAAIDADLSNLPAS